MVPFLLVVYRLFVCCLTSTCGLPVFVFDRSFFPHTHRNNLMAADYKDVGHCVTWSRVVCSMELFTPIGGVCRFLYLDSSACEGEMTGDLALFTCDSALIANPPKSSARVHEMAQLVCQLDYFTDEPTQGSFFNAKLAASILKQMGVCLCVSLASVSKLCVCVQVPNTRNSILFISPCCCSWRARALSVDSPETHKSRRNLAIRS